MIWLMTILACETAEYCTEEVQPSVTISVVDQQGAPIQQAQVFFSVDGSMEEEAILFSESNWVTTFEEPGDFRVRALVEAEVPSFEDCLYQEQQVQQVYVDMADNSCHVDGEHLTFVFTPTEYQCSE